MVPFVSTALYPHSHDDVHRTRRFEHGGGGHEKFNWCPVTPITNPIGASIERF
jgi:hypothetical protein